MVNQLHIGGNKTMDIEKATQELLDIADLIKELTLKKQKIENVLEPLRKEYSEIGYRLYDEVYEILDERGKPKYSNEDRRRLEAEHRLRNDKRAIELSREIRQHRNEIEEIVVEINRLQDRKLILLVAMGAPLPQDVINRENRGKYIIS